jgi:hypothetical protein
VTIVIDGVEYDTIKIPLEGVGQEPAVQHLKALGKELSLPRIGRIRSILRAGWGLVTEVGRGGRTAVFTDSLEELILVYRPVAAGDTAHVTQQLSANEVRTYALKMLRVLYEGTGADVRKRVNIAKLADPLGLTELAPVEQILSYLTAKGLIGKEMYWAHLTPHGIVDIEKALQHPDTPAAPYLPAINLINAQTVNLAPGAQLMQGAGTLQQTSQNGAGIPELRDALTEIEELARSLDAANRAQIDALVKAVRVETDRTEPNHSRIRTLLASMKTIAETFVGGTAANLATATIDPTNAPAIIELLHHLISHF